MISLQPPGFVTARQAFERAWHLRPSERYSGRFCFAGRRVRLRVAGRALAEHMRRPFAHLAVEIETGPAPDLTIDLWDTGDAAPAESAPQAAHEAPRTWDIGGGYFDSYDSGRVVRSWRPYGETWFDRGGGQMVGWRQNGERLLMDERSKPLPLLLAIWYFDHNVHIVHSGLVARDGQGVLIGGHTGSGKSTTALACALRGFDYLSDDHVGLEPASGGWLGHSLYSGARVEPHHIAAFPELMDGAIPSDDPIHNKFLLLLGETPLVRTARVAAIRAIVLPNLNGAAQPGLRPAAKIDVLRRIAPSSLIGPVTSGAAGLRRLAQLAGNVPAYSLDLGPQVREIPNQIEALLSRVRA